MWTIMFEIPLQLLANYKYPRIFMIPLSINFAIMSSFTVSLTGNSSELAATFFPELVLDDKYEYSCGLLDFTTYHSIPNITHKNNKFYYDNGNAEKMDFGIIELPIGCYEAEDALNYIKSALKEKLISFEYKINKNTLKTTINCSAKIVFGFMESILEVFGFKGEYGKQIQANVEAESDDVIKISKLSVIRVECNIVTGAYVNGRLCHSIYEFPSNKVDVGYKIIEQPRNIIYLPIVMKRISFIQISIVDQDGNPIDFRGEDITCRIHIKRNEN